MFESFAGAVAAEVTEATYRRISLGLWFEGLQSTVLEKVCWHSSPRSGGTCCWDSPSVKSQRDLGWDVR